MSQSYTPPATWIPAPFVLPINGEPIDKSTFIDPIIKPLLERTEFLYGQLSTGRTGVFDVRDFGAKLDGATDDIVALEAARDAAVSSGAAASVLYFPPGDCRISRPLVFSGYACPRIVGAGNSNQSADSRTRIAPHSSVLVGANISLLQIGDTGPTGFPIDAFVEGIIFDGLSVAKYGIRHLKGYGNIFRRISAINCTNSGYFADGAAAHAGGTLLNTKHESCFYTGNTSYGALISIPNSVVGAFSNWHFDSCGFDGNNVGARVAGNMATANTLATFANCETQATGSNSLEVDSAIANVVSSYFEGASGGGSSVHGDNGAIINVTGGSLGDGVGVGDSLSSIKVNDHVYTNANGFVGTSRRYGNLADDTGLSSALRWGPPNLAGKPGAVYVKGHSWTDAQGVVWECTTAGISSAAKFIARAGVIKRPLVLADFANGNKVFWPNEDFVLVDALLVITTTLVANTATFIEIGLSVANLDELFTSTQGAAANLTAGKAYSARANAGGHAALASGKVAFMAGSLTSATPTDGNFVSIFTDGSWSSGAGMLVLSGYFLKFN